MGIDFEQWCTYISAKINFELFDFKKIKMFSMHCLFFFFKSPSFFLRNNSNEIQWNGLYRACVCYVMLSTSLFWMYCMLHALHGIHLICFICFFPFHFQPMIIYLLAYKYACYSLFKLERLSKWWKQKEAENFS